jgi:hypothetical protein
MIWLRSISHVFFIAKHLSWKRLLLISAIPLCMLVYVSLFLDVAYETRSSVNVAKLYISSTTKDRIRAANRNDDEIVAIQVLTLNFEKNIRISTYIDIETDVLSKMYKSYLKSRVYDVPVFTNDKDTDTRMLSLLDGQFVCVPYSSSIAYKYVPEAEPYIKTACAMAIPPSTIDTLGLFVIYLKTELSISEGLILDNFSRDMATKIYDENEHIFRVGRGKASPR